MERALLVAATLLAGACVAPSPPAPPDMTPRAASAPAVERAMAMTSEISLEGSITRPKDVSGNVSVWIAGAPCDRAGQAYAVTNANGDRWSLTAFVHPGSSMFICAALSDGKNAYEVWGQADRAPVLGHEPGRVRLRDVAIALEPRNKIAPPSIARRR